MVKKCKKLHIGKTKFNIKCQNLKIGEWKIRNVKSTGSNESNKEEVYTVETEQEKYLGDITSQNEKNVKNIISSLLTNSEAWHNLTESDIQNSEKVDEGLKSNILGTPSTIPK